MICVTGGSTKKKTKQKKHVRNDKYLNAVSETHSECELKLKVATDGSNDFPHSNATQNMH